MECTRTFCPLFSPSSTVYLMQNYSDQIFLSCLYYQMDAGIFLSERYLSSTSTNNVVCSGASVRCFDPNGLSISRTSRCTPRSNTLGFSCNNSYTESRRIARQTVEIQNIFRTRIMGILSSLSLTLDTNLKNYVMSDVTLTKMSRPHELYERNFLTMYVSIQEETQANCTYSSQQTTQSQIQSLITDINTFLATEINKSIDILNGY